jgi:hypothetical protein
MTSAQASAGIRLAEKQISRYREDVEEWKRDHDVVAKLCWRIEELIESAHHSIHSIMRAEAALRADAISEGENLELSLKLRYVFNEWLELSKTEILTVVERLEERYNINGASVLRSDIETVQARLNSVRPVRIDETGRVFEETGEQVLIPGLTPEDIRKSLDDEKAGRVHRFEDVLALFDSHGV